MRTGIATTQGSRSRSAHRRGAGRALLAACAVHAVLAAPAVASTGTVRLQLSRQLASVGESIDVTVTIVIDGQAAYDEYFPPMMPDFSVSGSAMTSQNIEVVNWRVRRSETHVYRAVPTKAGRLSVGPAAIRIGGRTVKSARAFVEVRQGTAPPPPTTPSAPPPTLPQQAARQTAFIAGTATPRKVYVGEQVVAEWKLYTQSDVLGYQPLGQPSTDQFWSEDLESPKRLSFSRELVQGRVYYSAVVWRKALFPQQPGKLSVGALAARVRTLDDFARAGTERRSEPLEIEVVPLPTAGRPAGFPPQNVGQFELGATLDREQVKAGEAARLQVVVRGWGNVPQLKVGELPEVSGLKIYEPEVRDRLQRDEQLSGEKIIEWLLLPTRTGSVSIPSVSLDFFDPREKDYQRLSTKPLTLRVTGKLPGGASTPKGDVRTNVLGPDIRPPRSAGRVPHRARFSFLTGISAVLFALPFALFVGLISVEAIGRRLRRETARSLSRAAARRVRRRLRRANEVARAGDARACFGELSAAISEQVAERIEQRTVGLTREELSRAMLAAGFSEELVGQIVEELDGADFARFAGATTEAATLLAAVARVRGLVERIATARIAPRGAR